MENSYSPRSLGRIEDPLFPCKQWKTRRQPLPVSPEARQTHESGLLIPAFLNRIGAGQQGAKARVISAD
jgi:hypothetical protein